ncbi:MAG: TIGR02757 family protein [Nitritalea sp.]
MNRLALKDFLEEHVSRFNRPEFIPEDPISIPHAFTKKQDIEIAGFIAATLAWGQRKTIIAKCRQWMELMDHAPHDFMLQHQESDLKVFEQFKHRTFTPTDTLYFIAFFRRFYLTHSSLEEAFLQGYQAGEVDIMERLLRGFHEQFFADPFAPARTRKHVATPARKSACKRLNMFLRWMVRTDDAGVDFGIWKRIQPSQLICPCDLHVDRVARGLGLIQRKQTDWATAMELTRALRELDAADPVRYDFALFSLGVIGER